MVLAGNETPYLRAKTSLFGFKIQFCMNWNSKTFVFALKSGYFWREMKKTEQLIYAPKSLLAQNSFKNGFLRGLNTFFRLRLNGNAPHQLGDGKNLPKLCDNAPNACNESRLHENSKNRDIRVHVHIQSCSTLKKFKYLRPLPKKILIKTYPKWEWK